MKKIALLTLLIIITIPSFSEVFMVENTNDSGEGSLRQAINDASTTDTITFNPRLIAYGNNTIVLTSGEIAFTKNLTIIGLMTATDTLFVSGNGSSRVFNMDYSTSTLDRMAIIDGYANGFGGGIYAYSLTLKNSIIRGNTSFSDESSAVGGGVYAHFLNVENSTFKDNVAHSNTGAALGGGMRANNLTINHSVVSHNRAISSEGEDAAHGGGIETNYLTGNDIIVANNQVEGLYAYGGGIDVSKIYLLENSRIAENSVIGGTSGGYGGGLHVYASSGSTVSRIENTIIEENTIISTDYNTCGGGIFTRSNTVSTSGYSTLELVDVSIIGNSVSSEESPSVEGGGIYATKMTVKLENSVVLENEIIGNDYAQGGGIYIETPNTSSPSYAGLILLNSLVEGNSATSEGSADGGGIYAESKSITYTSSSSRLEVILDHSTVTDNLANSADGYAEGGGIHINTTATSGGYDSKTIVNITQSTISENLATAEDATGYGGGIYMTTGSNSCVSIVNINNSTINGNTASSINGGATGGGILSRAGSISSQMNVTINNSTIAENVTSTESISEFVTAHGGGISGGGTARTHMEITNSTISGNATLAENTSEGSGVRVPTTLPSTLKVGSSIVANNTGGDGDFFGEITTNYGYNIFGNAPPEAVETDQIDVSEEDLNLGLLENNGGMTLTMAPESGSVAINLGNPDDFTDAQNGSIDGIRDVGAAEFGIIACPILYDSITAIMCNDDTYDFGGEVLTEAGIYRDTVESVGGCDSVVILQLSTFELSTGVHFQTICEGESYDWIDGITYSSTTSLPQETLTSETGCDSVVTLYLAVIDADSVTDTKTVCGSYTWIDGITYTESESEATYTLINEFGCDSVITLDLTITESTTATDVQTACDSYEWIDGITYTESNNTATYTIVTPAGCDSIITLDLTIEHVDVSTTLEDFTITANLGGASYQWVDCEDDFSPIPGADEQSFEPTENGNYAVIITDDGCTDTSDCVAINGLSIMEHPSSSTIRIYPNPTSGKFTVDLNGEIVKTITIVDLTGKIALRQENITETVVEIAGDLLSQGVYFVHIQTLNEKQLTVKLVKE